MKKETLITVISTFLLTTLFWLFMFLIVIPPSKGTVETAFTTIDYSSGTMPLLAVSDFQIVCNTSACWFPECLHQYGIGDYVVSGRTTSYNDHFFWKSHVGNDDGSCNLHQYYPLKMIPTQEIKDNRELIVSTAWTPLTFFALSPKYLEELEQIIICN